MSIFEDSAGDDRDITWALVAIAMSLLLLLPCWVSLQRSREANSYTTTNDNISKTQQQQQQQQQQSQLINGTSLQTIDENGGHNMEMNTNNAASESVAMDQRNYDEQQLAMLIQEAILRKKQQRDRNNDNDAETEPSNRTDTSAAESYSGILSDLDEIQGIRRTERANANTGAVNSFDVNWVFERAQELGIRIDADDVVDRLNASSSDASAYEYTSTSNVVLDDSGVHAVAYNMSPARRGVSKQHPAGIKNVTVKKNHYPSLHVKQQVDDVYDSGPKITQERRPRGGRFCCISGSVQYCFRLLCSRNKESRRIGSLALWPLVNALIMGIFDNGIVYIISIYAGVGDVIAYALAGTIIDLTESLVRGLPTAVSVHTRRALAEGDLTTAAHYAQISIVTSLFYILPMLTVWSFVIKDVLEAIGVEEDTAQIAQNFTRGIILSGAARAIGDSLTALLGASGYDEFVSSIDKVNQVWRFVGTLLAVVILEGGAGAVGWAFSITDVLILVIIVCNSFWTQSFFISRFREGLVMSWGFKDVILVDTLYVTGLPLALGQLLDSSSSAAVTLLVPQVGVAETAAWAILNTIWETTKDIAEAFGEVTASRVDVHLANGKDWKARISADKGLIYGITGSSLIAGILIITSGPIGDLYSKDDDVSNLVSELLPVLSTAFVAVVVTYSCWAVLCAQNFYHMATFTMRAANWAIPIPVAAIAVYRFDSLGLNGIVGGVIAGTFFSAFFLWRKVLHSDWHTIMEDVQHRNHFRGILPDADSDDDDDESLQDGDQLHPVFHYNESSSPNNHHATEMISISDDETSGVSFSDVNAGRNILQEINAESRNVTTPLHHNRSPPSNAFAHAGPPHSTGTEAGRADALYDYATPQKGPRCSPASMTTAPRSNIRSDHVWDIESTPQREGSSRSLMHQDIHSAETPKSGSRFEAAAKSAFKVYGAEHTAVSESDTAAGDTPPHRASNQNLGTETSKNAEPKSETMDVIKASAGLEQLGSSYNTDVTCESSDKAEDPRQDIESTLSSSSADAVSVAEISVESMPFDVSDSVARDKSAVAEATASAEEQAPEPDDEPGPIHTRAAPRVDQTIDPSKLRPWWDKQKSLDNADVSVPFQAVNVVRLGQPAGPVIPSEATDEWNNVRSSAISRNSASLKNANDVNENCAVTGLGATQKEDRLVLASNTKAVMDGEDYQSATPLAPLSVRSKASNTPQRSNTKSDRLDNDGKIPSSRVNESLSSSFAPQSQRIQLEDLSLSGVSSPPTTWLDLQAQRINEEVESDGHDDDSNWLPQQVNNIVTDVGNTAEKSLFREDNHSSRVLNNEQDNLEPKGAMDWLQMRQNSTATTFSENQQSYIYFTQDGSDDGKLTTSKSEKKALSNEVLHVQEYASSTCESLADID